MYGYKEEWVPVVEKQISVVLLQRVVSVQKRYSI